MWQNKVNGALGIWVIALAFLGFSVSLQRFLLVLTGVAIAIIAFWGKSLVKPTEKLVQEIQPQEPQVKPGESQVQPAEPKMPEDSAPINQ